MNKRLLLFPLSFLLCSVVAVGMTIEEVDVDPVRMLLENANAGVLCKAAEAGNLQKVKKLLGQGVNVDAQNDYGETALIFAAQKGHADVIDVLCDYGADVNHKPWRRDNDGTALHKASMWLHLEAVQKLLERGAVVELPYQKNYLHLCLCYTTAIKSFLITPVLP